jgi:parallel beta helix pectate lyase-like protein
MIALALVLIILLVPAPALAGHVGCGSVITADTALDSDVVCEGETYGVTAITIATNGVTLDLAGYTVSGQRAYDDSSNGIATDGPRTGITVMGGTVVGFGAGLDLSASGSIVERLRIRDSGGVGLQVDGDGNTLRRIDAQHSAETGIYMTGTGAVLERSRVRGMLACVWITGDGPRMVRNMLADCYAAGLVTRYAGATFERNSITGNASGFYLSGEGAVVRRNDVTRNATGGLTVIDPRAIVDRNVASENGTVSDFDPQGGIEVFRAGAVVSRNRADRNGDYGIYAVPGVVDGGGNRARDNGDPAQCLNVACRR